MAVIKLTIPGRPITKKNSQRIIVNRRTNRPMVIPSAAYEEYETAALWHLKQYRVSTITTPVNACALYWMPNRRGKPDLLGLEQATADILEAAGIVENDVLIVSWDGSRVMGVDKADPRVEITLSEAQEVAV